jgi:DNA repair exonuclease SbcCD ATPase subunit
VKKEKQERQAELEDAKQDRMLAKTTVDHLQKSLQQRERERAQLKTQMSDLIQEAKSIRAKGGEVVKGLQEAVEGASAPGKTFEDLISSLETKKAKQEKKQKFAESMKGVVDQFRQSAKDRSCCPLCDSQLASSAAMATFEQNLLSLTNDAGDISGSSADQKISAYSADITALKEAQSKTVESAELHAKVQALESQADALRGDIGRAEGKLQDAEARERQSQENFDKAEQVEEVLRKLDLVGLQSLEKSIQSDEADLSKHDIDEVIRERWLSSRYRARD